MKFLNYPVEYNLYHVYIGRYIYVHVLYIPLIRIYWIYMFFFIYL